MVYPHNSDRVDQHVLRAGLDGRATVVFTDASGFVAERWLALVEAERVTHSHLVPTMLVRVLEAARVRATSTVEPADHRLRLRADAPERIERLQQAFGNVLMQGYGMTEI